MLSFFREEIDRYLEEKSERPKIIVIYGPTACGKTTLSLEIAKYLNTEIISADSRQIYRGLDIGTGKITEAEMRGIPHHMIDIIDPSEKYSMVDFRRGVDRIFEHVKISKNSQKQEIRGSEDFSKGAYGYVSDREKSKTDDEVPRLSAICKANADKIVCKARSFSELFIVCGGTGLYIDAILYDMDYPENPPDWKYREELEEIRQKEGNEALWKMLEVVDPEYAHELEVGNYRYIMRGLEVIRDTGKSKRDSHDTKKPRFSPLFLTPYTDSEKNRKKLYENIDARVTGMFKSGLLEEVRYNMDRFTSHCPGLTTIGYREVVEHFEGLHTLDETIALVAQHSRNYAKRQITWNKRYA